MSAHSPTPASQSTVKMNLARRAFVNSRPVTRLAIGLWLLSALGLAANVWLYKSYYQGTGARARRLAELEQELAHEHNAIAARQAQLAGLALGRQNATVDFFNQKIAERTFSWSRLFDRLVDVMPRGVRLTSLGQDKAERKSTQATAPAPGRGQEKPPAKPEEKPEEKVIRLHIAGKAESDEDLLAFVDAVFDSPDFKDPNLLRESQREDDYLSFDISVAYLPERPTPAVPGASAVPEPAAASPGGPPAASSGGGAP